MKPITLLIAWVFATMPSASQTPAQKPQFEVASIKPNVTSSIPPSYQAQPGGRFVIDNAPFKLIVALAYTLRDYQVFGGPGWITTDRWDVEAKAPEGSISAGLEYPSPATPNHPLFLMLRSLLEDRFQLKAHPERREEPVYELTVAKTGSRMKVSDDQASVEFPAGPNRTDPVPRGRIRVGLGYREGNAVRIEQLLSVLSELLGRPVINKTGLTGLYDFKLEWSPEEGPTAGGNGQAPPSPNLSGPSFFTAVQEQLGLKLESAKGPVDVLVIDSAQRPSEN